MWTNDTVLRIIKLYQSHECLWDTTNDGYKNKTKKNDAWEEIAKVMNMPRREVELKVHSVRSQFIRERKKMKMAMDTGGAVKPSSWFAYGALIFLLKSENQSAAVDMNNKQDINQGSPSTNDSETETNPINETYIEIDNLWEHKETKLNARNERKRPNEELLTNSSNLSKDSKRVIDEFEIYGQYVASELRNVKSEQAMLMAKYYINNIIIDARMGKLETNGNYTVRPDVPKPSNDVSLTHDPQSNERIVNIQEIKNETPTKLVVEVKCEPADYTSI